MLCEKRLSQGRFNGGRRQGKRRCGWRPISRSFVAVEEILPVRRQRRSGGRFKNRDPLPSPLSLRSTFPFYTEGMPTPLLRYRGREIGAEEDRIDPAPDGRESRLEPAAVYRPRSAEPGIGLNPTALCAHGVSSQLAAAVAPGWIDRTAGQTMQPPQ